MKFESLEECIVQSKGVMVVFELEGTTFRLKRSKYIEAAHKGGVVTAEALAKYNVGLAFHLTKWGNLLKEKKMNLCKSCEKRYEEANNTEGLCTILGTHQP